ncbi:MAG: hypothetical protein R3F30_09245 [Planctomycetota bacterium]
MNDRESRFLKILGIALESSSRGAGLSLRDAMEEARYAELREGFDAADLMPLIHVRPELVDQWVRYSEDKRTSGGWYLTRDGRVGQVSDLERSLRFGSVEQAVAEYVIRELDFWARIGREEGLTCSRCGSELPDFAELQDPVRTLAARLWRDGATPSAIRVLRSQGDYTLREAKALLYHVTREPGTCHSCRRPIATTGVGTCPNCSALVIDWSGAT